MMYPSMMDMPIGKQFATGEAMRSHPEEPGSGQMWGGLRWLFRPWTTPNQPRSFVDVT